VAAADNSSATDRIRDFLILVAAINVAIGIFNLLPLLPLDGGHLAVLGFEQARHGLRRLRGYRGPVQRVDFAKLLPATYATVVVLLGFSLLILSADIVNPIRLNQ
jgi:membrane-associated protease RseP (regulator of RpoE activity)